MPVNVLGVGQRARRLTGSIDKNPYGGTVCLARDSSHCTLATRRVRRSSSGIHEFRCATHAPAAAQAGIARADRLDGGSLHFATANSISTARGTPPALRKASAWGSASALKTV